MNKVYESILLIEVQIQFAIFLQRFPVIESFRNLGGLIIEFMFSKFDASTTFVYKALFGAESLFAVLDNVEVRDKR